MAVMFPSVPIIGPPIIGSAVTVPSVTVASVIGWRYDHRWRGVHDGRRAVVIYRRWRWAIHYRRWRRHNHSRRERERREG